MGGEGLHEEQLDWCIELPGHCDHHVGTEHPEDVVDEEKELEHESISLGKLSLHVLHLPTAQQKSCSRQVLERALPARAHAYDHTSSYPRCASRGGAHLDTEGDRKEVVCKPMLGADVPHSDTGADEGANQTSVVKLQINIAC